MNYNSRLLFTREQSLFTQQRRRRRRGRGADHLAWRRWLAGRIATCGRASGGEAVGGSVWWLERLQLEEEERRRRKICRILGKNAGFWLTLDPNFSPLRSSNPILFIGCGRGQSCLCWEKIAALDSVGKHLNRGLKVCTSSCQIWQLKAVNCPRWPLWATQRSRFQPFRPDQTILQDKGVSCGHFGASLVGFGGHTSRKMSLENSHSSSFLRKKVNSNMLFFFYLYIKKLVLQFSISSIRPQNRIIAAPPFTRLLQFGPWFRIFLIKSLIGP